MDETLKKTGSIKLKMYVNAYFTVLVILLITFFSYYAFFQYEFNTRFEDRLISISNTVALLINADELNQLRTPEDEKSKVYRDLRKILQDFKKTNPDILYIYTLRKTDEQNIWEFVVDADKQPFHIGDKYDVSGLDILKKNLIIPVVAQQYETDVWGNYLSGYAPIKDNSGQVIGVVGVDIQAKAMLSQQRKQLMVVSGFVGVLAVILTGYSTKKRTQMITRPVRNIISGIRFLLEGNLDNRLHVKTNDEFEIISRMLNHSAETQIEFKRTMEKKLNLAHEGKDKILKVYSDVMYSVTQGKFNLLSYKDSQPISLEGVLYSEFKLNNPEDVNKVRQLTERLTHEQNFSERKTKNVVICVSEAATNIIKHAQEGSMQFRIIGRTIRIIFIDNGPGMEYDKMPNMLFLKGFSTKPSMGCGYTLIYKYADKIFLSTSRKGTYLALDFNMESDTQPGKGTCDNVERTC